MEASSIIEYSELKIKIGELKLLDLEQLKGKKLRNVENIGDTVLVTCEEGVVALDLENGSLLSSFPSQSIHKGVADRRVKCAKVCGESGDVVERLIVCTSEFNTTTTT